MESTCSFVQVVILRTQNVPLSTLLQKGFAGNSDEKVAKSATARSHCALMVCHRPNDPASDRMSPECFIERLETPINPAVSPNGAVACVPGSMCEHD